MFLPNLLILLPNFFCWAIEQTLANYATAEREFNYFLITHSVTEIYAINSGQGKHCNLTPSRPDRLNYAAIDCKGM